MSKTPRIIKASDGRITFGPVRVNFADVFKPRKKTRQDGSTFESYELTFIWPKEGGEELKSKILELAKEAVVDKWPDPDTRPRKLTTPVKDCDDGEWTNDGVAKSEKYDYYKGQYLASASTTFQPGVVDQQCQPVLEASKIYGGCYVNVQCHIYAYDRQKKGVSLGLDNIQLVADGERLGGGSGSGPAATDAFAPIGGTSNPLGEQKESAAADDLFG